MARLARLLILFFLTLPWTAQAQDSTYARRVVCALAGADMYGRGMQHRGDSIAASYVRAQLQANGILPLCKNYYQPFVFPQTRTKPPLVKAGYRSQNVCGYLPGEVDTMVVFTAHYEHLGMNGDTIFFGAHDNASGTAAVLDMARVLSQRQRHYTYLFLFFGGEESGLVGSRHFVEQPPVNLSKVKLLINIDLFCGGEEGLMVVNATDDRTKPFVDLLQSLNDARGYAAKLGRRANAANSDHWFFTNHCPAIFIYTLGGPYGGYHSPADTCEGCGLGHYNDFMSLILTLIEHLEN